MHLISPGMVPDPPGRMARWSGARTDRTPAPRWRRPRRGGATGMGRGRCGPAPRPRRTPGTPGSGHAGAVAHGGRRGRRWHAAPGGRPTGRGRRRIGHRDLGHDGCTQGGGAHVPQRRARRLRLVDRRGRRPGHTLAGVSAAVARRRVLGGLTSAGHRGRPRRARPGRRRRDRRRRRTGGHPCVARTDVARPDRRHSVADDPPRWLGHPRVPCPSHRRDEVVATGEQECDQFVHPSSVPSARAGRAPSPAR